MRLLDQHLDYKEQGTIPLVVIDDHYLYLTSLYHIHTTLAARISLKRLHEFTSRIFFTYEKHTLENLPSHHQQQCASDSPPSSRRLPSW